MTIEVNDSIKYLPIKSKRFLCSSCLEFLIEMTPVIKPGMGATLFKHLREERNKSIISGRGMKPNTKIQVKLLCHNGHHESPFFSFHDITLKGKTFK